MTPIRYLRNVNKYDGTTAFSVTDIHGNVVLVSMGGTADLEMGMIDKLLPMFVLVDPVTGGPPGGGDPDPDPPPGTAAAFWKAPVQVLVDLPTTGNEIGDVRLVIDAGSLYTWDGTAWDVLLTYRTLSFPLGLNRLGAGSL